MTPDAGYHCSNSLQGGRLAQENSENKGLVGKSALESSETIVKWIAIGAALVAALGYPAVAVQFLSRGIPVDLLDKTQAIRAGALPALALLAAVGVLRYFLKIAANDPDMPGWTRAGYVTKAYAGIVVGLIPLRVAGPLTKSALWFLGFLYQRPWTPRTVIIDWLMAMAGSVILAAILLWFVMPVITFVRRFNHTTPYTIERWILKSYQFIWRPLSRQKPLQLVISSWLGFGMLSLLCEYWSMSIPGPVPIAWLAGDAPFQGINLWAVFSIFSFLYAVEAQAGLPDDLPQERQRRLQMELRVASIAIAYLPLVLVYSLEWYPTMPALVGGGKPQLTTVWLESKRVPEKSTAMLHLHSSVEGDQMRLDRCFLVHANSEIVILSDSESPWAATLVVPRHYVTAFVSPRGMQQNGHP